MINKNSISEKFKDHPLFTQPVVGMNYGFMAKKGYYNTEYAKKQPKLMADMGINWVTLNANFCMENLASTRCFLDFEYSSTETELIEMAKRLHDVGIHIMLKPCMTLLDGTWMGRVRFPSDCEQTQINGVKLEYWKKWFHSFGECTKYFAEVAEKCGIESYLIGAEYYGTEEKDEGWIGAIEKARDYYSGPISYEFIPRSITEQLTATLDWFNYLDFLSLSYYPAAQAPNKGFSIIHNPDVAKLPPVSLESMMDYLKPEADFVKGIIERFNKPLVFTELGARSSRGNTIRPADYRWASIYYGEEQANYMEAVFRTFSQIENWMGFLWWKWDETQDRPHYKTDPAGDQGFTIQGKPAEKVFRSWQGRF